MRSSQPLQELQYASRKANHCLLYTARCVEETGPYESQKAKLVVREMTDWLVLDLVDKGLVTDQMVLTVGYDIENLTNPARRAKYHLSLIHIYTFHRDLAKGNEPLPEFVLFDMRTKHEYEVNAFASHLIIDDDELIDLMKQDYDVVQLSAAMGTNSNLMLIKLNELNRMGWQLNLPYVPHSDFLKNVRPEG